jgi:hypothetical protein
MSLLSDVVASLRESGATAAVVRDGTDGGFAWAELGDLAASLDYWFDEQSGSWVVKVAMSPSHVIAGQYLIAPLPVDVYAPTSFDLHELVLRQLQTESTTP